MTEFTFEIEENYWSCLQKMTKGLDQGIQSSCFNGAPAKYDIR